MLPANVARELLLTGDSMPAERAERLGFVNLASVRWAPHSATGPWHASPVAGRVARL